MKLNIASIGDIHLNHKKTTTREIIENLDIAFPDNEETAQLDYIFITGDVFETLVNLDDPVIWEIKSWAFRLLRLCKKHDIRLRIVKGTPSHDWNQSKIFPEINAQANIGANLKYFDKLTIDIEDDTGISCLYVPDEWDLPERTFSQVRRMLNELNIDSVDFAIMHGSFEHQLPIGIKAPRFSNDDYLSIVKRYIFVGHIHQHSIWDRILAAGSFDRLRQNEEDQKGHFRISIDDDTEDKITFVVNEGAKTYRKIRIGDMGIAEIINLVSLEVASYRTDSYVEIVANADNPILADFDIIKNIRPDINWSKSSIETEKEIIEIEESSDDSNYEALVITPNNLADLVTQKMINLGYDENFVRESVDYLLSLEI